MPLTLINCFTVELISLKDVCDCLLREVQKVCPQCNTVD